MTAESSAPPNQPPRKRRLGCLAWLGIGLLVGVLLLVGLGLYGIHRQRRALVERATAALLADDAATALTALNQAHQDQPDDESVAQLYQAAQQKWLESVDRQIADKTPAQRYSTLMEYPVKDLRRQLSEPLATTFQQFVERNMADAQVQIQETVERAMDLVEAGQFNEGWKEMETLRVCSTFPGLSELWNNFDAFYTARLLVHAGDLGQNGQIAAAREDLAWAQKNRRPTPDALAESNFRIDLGHYNLLLNQAVVAATKGDAKSAQARLEETQPLLSRLLASGELQNLFPDLPEKDRGSPLVSQFNAAQSAIATINARTPAR